MSLISGKSDAVSVALPAEYASQDRMLFDMTFFARQLGFSAFGNEKSMLYTLPSGQKLTVTDGSNTVYVDGEPVSLKSTVRFSKERVYIPLGLFDGARGVTVSYSGEERRLTLLCSPEDMMLLHTAISAADHPRIEE